MPYTISYTDVANNGTITIEDNTLNNETSLKLPGRNTTAYGSAIAENFLHLLENFASTTEPSRAIEGQLWYDTTVGSEVLKVYDGTRWIPSGGLKKANAEPSVADSQIGDLWADTDNQQLYLFTGSGWILVGPQFSDGLTTGVTPTTVVGTDNNNYTIILVEVAAQPVAIISSQTFNPKIGIPGFSTVQAGINLSTRNITGDGVPKFYGTAEKAENLIVNNTSVEAGQFLRKDDTNTTLFPINVANNTGVSYGINSELNIGVENQAGIIQNKIEGSSVDIRVRSGGASRTVMRIDGTQRVGINNEAPDEALDVIGNIATDSAIKVNGTAESTNISTGSITTLGGVGIAKSVNIGSDLDIQGLTTTAAIVPDGNNTRNIGSATAKYANAYATTFIGNLTGNVSGTVSGRAGSSDRLTSSTTFRLSGQVSSVSDIVFDGQYVDEDAGETPLLKVFDTVISNAFIADQDDIPNGEAESGDHILVNKVGDPDNPGIPTGLFKITTGEFLAQVPTMPVGTIVPYAGDIAPLGWRLCDGTTYSKSFPYDLLSTVLGDKYRAGASIGTGEFKVPDLRGRIVLGNDPRYGTSEQSNMPVEADYAGALGGTGGQEEVTIDVSNLPEHQHDLRGSDGNQYYAIADTLAFNDADTKTIDAPTGTNNATGLENSGDIDTTGSVGQALNIMNPTMTMNYIIYIGRNA